MRTPSSVWPLVGETGLVRQVPAGRDRPAAPLQQLGWSTAPSPLWAPWTRGVAPVARLRPPQAGGVSPFNPAGTSLSLRHPERASADHRVQRRFGRLRARQRGDEQSRPVCADDWLLGNDGYLSVLELLVRYSPLRLPHDGPPPDCSAPTGAVRAARAAHVAADPSAAPRQVVRCCPPPRTASPPTASRDPLPTVPLLTPPHRHRAGTAARGGSIGPSLPRWCSRLGSSP